MHNLQTKLSNYGQTWSSRAERERHEARRNGSSGIQGRRALMGSNTNKILICTRVEEENNSLTRSRREMLVKRHLFF